LKRTIVMLMVLLLVSCGAPAQEIVRETVVVTRVMPAHTAYPCDSYSCHPSALTGAEQGTCADSTPSGIYSDADGHKKGLAG
jgi:uncharacterized protein YcfL